jgi:RNA polymerase sigma-70 factor (ECF subfamily)
MDGRQGERVHDDDQDRFLRHWTLAQSSLAGYVAAVMADPHAADDVLQNIAVAALRRFPDYDPSRPFVAWAMGIAKIEILTHRRDRARAAVRFQAATVEALAEVWEELLPDADLRRDALGECLGRITGRNRTLVALRYEQERPLDEIAATLRMTSIAVRVALSRLRGSLHACIERRLGTDAP